VKGLTIKIGKRTDSFISCYTNQGYISFLDKVIEKDKVYVLLGGTFQVKSRIIREIANNLADRGFDVNLLHNGLNPDILEGARVSPLNVAIIDGSSARKLKDDAIVLLVKDIIDIDKLKQEQKEEIEKLEAWKRELVEKYPRGVKDKEKGNLSIIPGAKQFFAQALTYKGKINYYDKILLGLEDKRYLNNLDSHSASEILTFFAKTLEEGGVNTEVYHNFLEPEIIELLVIRESNLAIGIKSFDLQFKPINNPHVVYVEKVPENPQIIIDAMQSLAKINRINERIEEIYLGVTDFSSVHHISELVLVDIVKNMLKKNSD